MDFETPLPRSPKGNNVTWTIVDRIIKAAQFIQFRVIQSTETLV